MDLGACMRVRLVNGPIFLFSYFDDLTPDVLSLDRVSPQHKALGGPQLQLLKQEKELYFETLKLQV